MKTAIKQPGLFSIGITGRVAVVADIQPSLAAQGPAAPPAKLHEGWHDTTKHGPVYVSPSGRAWAVKIIGDRMANVVIDVSLDDVIGRSAIEKMRDVVAYNARKRLQQDKRK